MIKHLLLQLLSVYFGIYNQFFMKRKGVVIGDNNKLRGYIHIKNGGKIVINSEFSCNSGLRYNPIGNNNKCRFIIKKDAYLKIGKNVGISNTTIYCSKFIEIGDNVTIGSSCQIWDTDFHPINPNDRFLKLNEKSISKNIIIRENVFIGAMCIILKGVQIGRNSVIGAGSVVSKNIPENEVWAGNPIRFIKKIQNDK